MLETKGNKLIQKYLSILLLHFNFLKNLLLFVSSISVGKGKLQKERYSSIMSLFAVLNKIIRNLMTTKLDRP